MSFFSKQFVPMLFFFLLAILSHVSGIELQQSIEKEVALMRNDIDQIIKYVLDGPFRYITWNRLANFTDKFGHRLSGSSSQRAAVEWALKALKAEGFDNVHGEAVQVPHWERGHESATLLQPRHHEMNILGLGTSIGTDATGIEADVLVVNSFDELKNQTIAGQSQGKIILFNFLCDWDNEPVGCYGKTVMARVIGATEAAKAGGVASLVRTIGALSINSPHTGEQAYDAKTNQVPTACITLEDADMLQRMQDRGEHIRILLKMEAKNYPDVTSHNVIADITGSTYPDEIVLVSGHLDSWDVGVGAMDDGGGAFISWSVLSILKALNIRPLRTIRLAMWSCEEFGGVGSQQYYARHKADDKNYDFVMESDMGVFKSRGLQYQGPNEGVAILEAIGQTLAVINATRIFPNTGGGEDIDGFEGAGVPGGSLSNENQRYFWFHHSQGDTMTVLNPTDVDTAVITWAVHAFGVANLEKMMPRGKPKPPMKEAVYNSYPQRVRRAVKRHRLPMEIKK